jgi:hypothetical protein
VLLRPRNLSSYSSRKSGGWLTEGDWEIYRYEEVNGDSYIVWF